MSDSNTPNGTNNESSVENGKKVNDNKQKFINSFIRNQINGDNQDKKNEFLDSIYGVTEKSSELKESLKKHFEAGEEGEYEGFDINDITLDNLKNSTYGDYIYLKNKRDSLEKVFNKDFDIKDGIYSDDIFPEIKKLKDRELNKLLKSDSEREKFIKNIFKNNKDKIPTRKKILDFLFNLASHKSVIEKFAILSEEQKNTLSSVFYKINNLYEISVDDLDVLFSEPSIFTFEQKKEIVSLFLPNITLKKAQELWLITENDAKKIKLDLITEIEGKEFNLEDQEKENVINQLDDEKINFDYSSYLNKYNIDLVITDRKIKEEYYRIIKRVKKESLYLKVNKSEFLQNVIDTEKIKLNENLDGNDILKESNIIAINITNPNIKQKEIQYLEIAEIDFEKGFICFFNRGLNSYNKSVSVKKDDKIPLNIFLKFVKNGFLYGNKFNNIGIFLGTTLNTKIDNGEIIIKELSEKEEKRDKKILKYKDKLISLLKGTNTYSDLEKNEQEKFLLKFIEEEFYSFSEKELSGEKGELIKNIYDLKTRIFNLKGENWETEYDSNNIVKDIGIFNENEKEIKNDEEFKKELKNTKKINSKDIDKLFIPRNIVIFKREYEETINDKTEKKEGFSFLEIIKVEDGVVEYYDRGKNKYNSTNTINPKKMDYNTFIKLLKSQGLNYCHILDEETLVKEILNGKIEEIVANGETTIVNKLKLEKIEKLRSKLNLEEEEFKNFLEKEKYYGEDSEEEELFNHIKDYNKFDYNFLLKSLDDTYVDGEGITYGFDKGTTFQTDKGGIYTIDRVDKINEIIYIVSPHGNNEISYYEFITAFKSTKAKRKAKSNNQDELFQDIQMNSKISDDWKDFECKNNGFYKKDSNSGIEYDYLVGGKEGEDLVKIHSFTGSEVKISFGEFKNNTEKDKDGKEKDNKKYVYGLNDKVYTVSTGWLNTYIKENELLLRSLDEEKDVKEENIDTVKMKAGFFSGLFQRWSVAELIAGGKMGIEGIENYLKEGNDEHAAKFAQGVFGKFLPGEIQSDLISRVETAGKKRMDDYVQKLKDIDSWPATEMIIGWLKNSNASQYKKEAGFTFMVEKYGTLYAKALYEYKGKFLWYESLGGKVGDKLFNKVKNDCLSNGETFSEEELIYKLLQLQCRQSPPEGGYPGGIKRRSRIHKEFKKHRAVGKQEENETGLNDGSDERTINGRLNGAIAELQGGTYANAIGFLESIINKGGDLKKMNKIPFIIHFSGIMHGFDRIKTLDLLKNFPAKGMNLITMRFLSTNGDINLLNDTTLEICKRVSKKKGNDEMYNRAKKIFGNIHNSSIKESKKIEEADNFYEDYGEIITNALHMVNNGKTDENSRFNKMIFLEKDDRKDKDGKIIEGNPIFKRYYESVEGFTEEAVFTKEEMMADAFVKTGISGINIRRITEEVLGFGAGANLSHQKIHSHVWSEIVNEFNAISKRKYSDDDSENEQIKLKLIKDMLRGLISGFLKNHSNRTQLKSYNSPTGAFSELNSWGISMKELDDNKVNPSSLMNKSSSAGEKLLDKFASNLLEHELTGRDFSSQTSSGDGLSDLDELIGDVKGDVDENLF